jgi:hypothetical protein
LKPLTAAAQLARKTLVQIFKFVSTDSASSGSCLWLRVQQPRQSQNDGLSRSRSTDGRQTMEAAMKLTLLFFAGCALAIDVSVVVASSVRSRTLQVTPPRHGRAPAFVAKRVTYPLCCTSFHVSPRAPLTCVPFSSLLGSFRQFLLSYSPARWPAQPTPRVLPHPPQTSPAATKSPPATAACPALPHS